MRNLYSILLLFALNVGVTTAQKTVKVYFKQEKDTISRDIKPDVLPITLKGDLGKIDKDSLKFYTVAVKTNDEKSTFARASYNLNFNSFTLDKLSAAFEYTFYLNLLADPNTDRERHLYLYLEITKNDKQEVNAADSNLTLDILVHPYSGIKKYNYLAYVGTNFDLVDGIQAKNLFFATSIFSTPEIKKGGFGFFLTLYGNRAVTSTDISDRVRYAPKIVPLPGDSARTYFEEALKTVTRVTDNLGATFSPLIRIGKTLGDPKRETQLYYAPQFELIWRRSKSNYFLYKQYSGRFD